MSVPLMHDDFRAVYVCEEILEDGTCNTEKHMGLYISTRSPKMTSADEYRLRDVLIKLCIDPANVVINRDVDVDCGFQVSQQRSSSTCLIEDILRVSLITAPIPQIQGIMYTISRTSPVSFDITDGEIAYYTRKSDDPPGYYSVYVSGREGAGFACKAPSYYYDWEIDLKSKSARGVGFLYDYEGGPLLFPDTERFVLMYWDGEVAVEYTCLDPLDDGYCKSDDVYLAVYSHKPQPVTSDNTRSIIEGLAKAACVDYDDIKPLDLDKARDCEPQVVSCKVSDISTRGVYAYSPGETPSYEPPFEMSPVDGIWYRIAATKVPGKPHLEDTVSYHETVLDDPAVTHRSRFTGVTPDGQCTPPEVMEREPSNGDPYVVKYRVNRQTGSFRIIYYDNSHMIAYSCEKERSDSSGECHPDHAYVSIHVRDTWKIDDDMREKLYTMVQQLVCVNKDKLVESDFTTDCTSSLFYEGPDPRPCPVKDCSPCRKGTHQRKDMSGCLTCDCEPDKEEEPICQEKDCPSSKACKMMDGKPQCLEISSKHGHCPEPFPLVMDIGCNEGPNGMYVRCQTDEDCPRNKKCCYSGCGYLCALPDDVEDTSCKVSDIHKMERVHFNVGEKATVIGPWFQIAATDTKFQPFMDSLVTVSYNDPNNPQWVYDEFVAVMNGECVGPYNGRSQLYMDRLYDVNTQVPSLNFNQDIHVLYFDNECAVSYTCAELVADTDLCTDEGEVVTVTCRHRNISQQTHDKLYNVLRDACVDSEQLHESTWNVDCTDKLSIRNSCKVKDIEQKYTAPDPDTGLDLSGTWYGITYRNSSHTLTNTDILSFIMHNTKIDIGGQRGYKTDYAVIRDNGKCDDTIYHGYLWESDLGQQDMYGILYYGEHGRKLRDGELSIVYSDGDCLVTYMCTDMDDMGYCKSSGTYIDLLCKKSHCNMDITPYLKIMEDRTCTSAASLANYNPSAIEDCSDRLDRVDSENYKEYLAISKRTCKVSDIYKLSKITGSHAKGQGTLYINALNNDHLEFRENKILYAERDDIHGYTRYAATSDADGTCKLPLDRANVHINTRTANWYIKGMPELLFHMLYWDGEYAVSYTCLELSANGDGTCAVPYVDIISHYKTVPRSVKSVLADFILGACVSPADLKYTQFSDIDCTPHLRGCSVPEITRRGYAVDLAPQPETMMAYNMLRSPVDENARNSISLLKPVDKFVTDLYYTTVNKDGECEPVACFQHISHKNDRFERLNGASVPSGFGQNLKYRLLYGDGIQQMYYMYTDDGSVQSTVLYSKYKSPQQTQRGEADTELMKKLMHDLACVDADDIMESDFSEGDCEHKLEEEPVVCEVQQQKLDHASTTCKVKDIYATQHISAPVLEIQGLLYVLAYTDTKQWGTAEKNGVSMVSYNPDKPGRLQQTRAAIYGEGTECQLTFSSEVDTSTLQTITSSIKQHLAGTSDDSDADNKKKEVGVHKKKGKNENLDVDDAVEDVEEASEEFSPTILYWDGEYAIGYSCNEVLEDGVCAPDSTYIAILGRHPYVVDYDALQKIMNSVPHTCVKDLGTAPFYEDGDLVWNDFFEPDTQCEHLVRSCSVSAITSRAIELKPLQLEDYGLSYGNAQVVNKNRPFNGDVVYMYHTQTESHEDGEDSEIIAKGAFSGLYVGSGECIDVEIVNYYLGTNNTLNNFYAVTKDGHELRYHILYNDGDYGVFWRCAADVGGEEECPPEDVDLSIRSRYQEVDERTMNKLIGVAQHLACVHPINVTVSGKEYLQCVNPALHEGHQLAAAQRGQHQ